MRLQISVIVVALAAASSACKSDRETVQPPDVMLAFPNLTVPPGGRFVSRGGGADATQLTVHAPGTLEGVSNYFREYLSQPGWRLVSDSKDSAGGVLLYGETPTRPMWIRLTAIDGGVEAVMTGAVPGYDTTFARKQADARDTTNTLRPR
jgi:hypothetical protein